jgi:hypothetical protein
VDGTASRQERKGKEKKTKEKEKKIKRRELCVSAPPRPVSVESEESAKEV